MEIPLIAGVGGGVGTTTLAWALRSIDCRIYRGGTAVDVLVARATMYSLGCAQRAIAATPAPPILAVVEDGPGWGVPRAAKARLRMTEPHVATVVVVPFVVGWREMDNPQSDAAHVLLADPIPKSRRAFVAALHALVDEITPRVMHRSALEQQMYDSTSGGMYAIPMNPTPVPAGWPGSQ